MSPSVEKAIGYLKVVTLMNELEDQNNYNVQQIIDAISRINESYARKIIKSSSVKRRKAWTPEEPDVPPYAAETAKQLICVNSKLSLPRGGEWLEVCYLPEGAFSDNAETRAKTFLSSNDVYQLLAEIGGMIGTPKVGIDKLRQMSKDAGLTNQFFQGQDALR